MKPIYTVRTTVIESFREWINCDEQDAEDKFWITEENVIGGIKGIERSNIKADYGTAGHSIIENPNRYKTETGYQVKDFVFTDVQAAPMLKFRQEHPLMTREIALSKLYSTPNFDIIVTGTCDHMEGNIMRDTKYKFSNFDVADFLDSFQWRNYLNSADMDIFYYDFFRVHGFETMADIAKAKISECDSMMVKRYPGMEQDIQAIINEFAAFVEHKNLLPYLTIDEKKRKRIAAGDSRLLKLI